MADNRIVKLDYLVDNGRLFGWATDTVDAELVRWSDDGSYSVRRILPDGTRKVIGSGDTPDEAWTDARLHLTDERRRLDRVKPAMIAWWDEHLERVVFHDEAIAAESMARVMTENP